MSSLRILIALWAAMALWKSAVTAIRTAGEQSELDAEAAFLSESFQNGTLLLQPRNFCKLSGFLYVGGIMKCDFFFL